MTENNCREILTITDEKEIPSYIGLTDLRGAIHIQIDSDNGAAATELHSRSTAAETCV